MPFPTRATRTILIRALKEAHVPRGVALETLARRDTLTTLRRGRSATEDDPDRAVWVPFLEELTQPSPPGAAPRCFLAARLIASIEAPTRVAEALRRHLPAALLGRRPPTRAPIPYVEPDAYDMFEDIPF